MIPRVSGHVGQNVVIKGSAYDFGHAIAAIEFSLDEGAHWTRYETKGTNDYQNLTWTFSFVPEKPGMYAMRVRSVNDEGQVSPESAYVELEIGCSNASPAALSACGALDRKWSEACEKTC